MRRAWIPSMRLSTCAAILAIAGLAAATTLTPLATNDLWVHLAVGRETARELSEGHGVPKEERFSFTAEHRPLVPHEWLSELLFYFGYRAAGPVGIQALRLLLVLLMLAGAGAAARIAGAERETIFWTLLLLLLAAAPRLIERPHLFTYAFSTWTLALLASDVRAAREGGIRRAWFLPALMTVWANLHGGFIVGLFLIGCFAAGAARSAWKAAGQRHGRPLRRRSVRLGWILAASVACSALLNPSGPALLQLPFQLASSETVTQRILEWRSPLSGSYWSTVPFALTALWAVMLAGGFWLSRRSGREKEPLIALTFGILASRQVRSVGDFAVFTAPWMATALAGAWGSLRPGSLPGREILPAGTAACAALAIALFGYPIRPHSRVHCIPPLVAPSTPVAAAEFIAQQGWLPPEARVFNSYTLGGYLAWRLHDRARILIDSRNEAYGDELTGEILRSFRDAAVFEQALERWHPDLLVLAWRQMGGNSPVLKKLAAAPAWSLVFLDDGVAVYCPRERATDPLRFASPVAFDLRKIGPEQAAAALEEGRRLSSWQPEGVIATLLTGRALMVSGRKQEALQAFERCARHDPDSPALWGMLAAARNAVGDHDGAAVAKRRAELLAASGPE